MNNEMDKCYFLLFNAITDAIELFEGDWYVSPQAVRAVEVLKNAQCAAIGMTPTQAWAFCYFPVFSVEIFSFSTA
jgi:hypothetical protein